MKKPLLLVVMDGVGISDDSFGNAVKNAYKPNLDYLMDKGAYIDIKASGYAVGLPNVDDMGNSEVGHNAIGCGQIYSQGAKLVNEGINDGSIFSSDTWDRVVSNARGFALHFIGLLSDGNVHSHIDHLKAMIRQAKVDGVSQVYLHILLDGRDVLATSALEYIGDINLLIDELNDDGFNCCIASGGGRMSITMDRYLADWDMVKRGWDLHVLGIGRGFDSAIDAVKTYRDELDCIDQDLPGFVIVKDGQAVGTINDHDSVVLFNFRGDRAIEISLAFDDLEFDKFDRVRVPNVVFAGMLQYDGDLLIPKLYLVDPPKIKDTLSEFLVSKGVNSFAISETQKYGHMTYFFNGNKSEKFSDDLETWVEIKGDNRPLQECPWMKSALITDKLIDAIKSQEFQFLRVNYPNGDMVGHTGDYQATLIGVESVDLALGRLIKVCDLYGVTLVVCADHGNADQMYEKLKNLDDKIRAKTSHTLNLVPFIVYNSDIELLDGEFGLSNIARTICELMGYDGYSSWDQSMIK